MRESEKKGEASGRDDKIMIIEKRLESILHMCACIIRERGGEKGREGGRGRGKGREGGREGERERERERERNTVGHATRHTSLTNSVTWPLTRRSRKAASNVWLRTCTSIQSDWKRMNDICTESILEILTLSVRRRFYVKNRICEINFHIYIYIYIYT